MGVSRNGVPQIAGWFIMENPQQKWMITGGYAWYFGQAPHRQSIRSSYISLCQSPPSLMQTAEFQDGPMPEQKRFCVYHVSKGQVTERCSRRGVWLVLGRYEMIHPGWLRNPGRQDGWVAQLEDSMGFPGI